MSNSQFLPEIQPEFIEQLLSQETPAEQLSLLREAGLFNEHGLSSLLDETEEVAASEPAIARRLSELCEIAAATANLPAIAPRAQYLRAQTHAMHGEFDLALDLIQSASSTYATLGMTQEALRTQVGLMNVLDELGRYPEVLEIGASTLAEIALISQTATAQTLPQLQRIAARIHVNRGVSFMQLGQYPESIAAYAHAETIFTTLQDHEWIANVINNQGLVQTYLGRVREALTTFERANALRVGAPPSLPHAHTLLNIGEAQCLLGNYAQSLVAFRQAQELLVTLDARVDQQINQLHIADAYLTLNLYPEASAAYGATEQALGDLNMVYERGLALWGHGAAQIAQARFAQAEPLLIEATTLFGNIENAPLTSSIILERAALQALQNRHAEALTLAHRALSLVDGGVDAAGDWPVQRVYAHLRIADLLLPTDPSPPLLATTDEVETHLTAAEQLLATLTLPHLRYRLLQRWGQLRLLQGRDDDAQIYFQSAIDEIEQLRNTLPHEVMRTSFLVDKVAAYEGLMQLYLRRDDEQSIRQAFDVAERARSRALVEMLAGVVDNRMSTDDDPLLAAQLHTLQADLNAIFNKLLDGSEGVDPTLSGPHLRARAAEVEQQISWLRLQATSAKIPTTIPPDPLAASLSIQEIQAQIPTDVVMLTYFILGEEINAFVITRHTFRLIRAVSTTPIVQQLLQRLNLQWDRFSAGRPFVERHLHLLEQSTQRILMALHKELLAPLESTLQELSVSTQTTIPKLAIVPHGLLHQLPFQALHDGNGYLLERYAISYAPSATAWALCQRRGTRQQGNALVLGVADASLPAVEIEVNAVAQQLQAANYAVDLRQNERVTLASLPAALAACRLLHIACHGIFRADSPMFSALKLHDGWFTASDAMQTELSGATVTLSACESGRSRVMVGDEILGLIRAFLGAGASTLVVSQWLVQDEAAAYLMATWYKCLKTSTDKADALRSAQLATKARYPHPYYWSPFILIGQIQETIVGSSTERQRTLE